MSLINPLNNTQSATGQPQSASTVTPQAATQTTVQSNAAATSTPTTGNPFLDSLRLPAENSIPEANSQDLSQEDFFSLLSQQLSMQDPFKPVDNDQMIQQMASFSTVDGISKLNEEIVNLNALTTSSQALQASGLVGQKVLIPSDTGYISAEEPVIKGVVSTPETIKDLTVRVEDESGQLISTFQVDGSAGGNVEVTWDGMGKNGEPVAEGSYTLKVTGKVDGKSEELPVSTYAHVTSVSLGTAATGAILNLRGVGGIKISDVLAVSES
ncbi:flagellar hook assembly protein FlgD [Shewanella sp. Choline-02u-19]|uniref:flagellar hook assembly protein FlgD n=1 Tax=unclassified Shewanella TaxID=196818 RepID=UPI000C34944D|nr:MULTISPECIES: flagellar hook assembly protein FlgD [unclassified Shewanella]PKG56536.1 flagellar hook assembly protein FlgD [Shewanella sp. GutDb-MelDb]PKG75930.1 flagellar hook assembly protein FlgD [Shewanella sp. GutCb]PKH55733.1 flagellar hook assembly protein FlgD [Shewanella sp. Bg11-22]PKI26853.1 flagellar hook assembly protein FlgD [Shewanella sp. Choline-02u-19]